MFAPGSRLEEGGSSFLREAMHLITLCTSAVSSLKKCSLKKCSLDLFGFCNRGLPSSMTTACVGKPEKIHRPYTPGCSLPFHTRPCAGRSAKSFDKSLHSLCLLSLLTLCWSGVILRVTKVVFLPRPLAGPSGSSNNILRVCAQPFVSTQEGGRYGSLL